MIFRIRVFSRDISNYAFHVDIMLVSQQATLNLMVYSLYMFFFRKIPKLVSLKMGHRIEKQRIVIFDSPPAAQRASCWVQRPHWWWSQNIATIRYNSIQFVNYWLFKVIMISFRYHRGIQTGDEVIWIIPNFNMHYFYSLLNESIPDEKHMLMSSRSNETCRGIIYLCNWMLWMMLSPDIYSTPLTWFIFPSDWTGKGKNISCEIYMYICIYVCVCPFI